MCRLDGIHDRRATCLADTSASMSCVPLSCCRRSSRHRRRPHFRTVLTPRIQGQRENLVFSKESSSGSAVQRCRLRLPSRILVVGSVATGKGVGDTHLWHCRKSSLLPLQNLLSWRAKRQSGHTRPLRQTGKTSMELLVDVQRLDKSRFRN